MLRCAPGTRWLTGPSPGPCLWRGGRSLASGPAAAASTPLGTASLAPAQSGSRCLIGQRIGQEVWLSCEYGEGVGAEDSRVLRGAGDDLQPGDEQLSRDQSHHFFYCMMNQSSSLAKSSVVNDECCRVSNTDLFSFAWRRRAAWCGGRSRSGAARATCRRPASSRPAGRRRAPD